MTLPRSAMITPDVVSSSDASWAVRSCCQNAQQALVEEEEEQEFQDECTSTSSNKDRFWDSFAVSSEVFKKHLSKASYQNGTKLLVTIFGERKKAEDILMKAQRRATEEAAESEHRTLANSSVVSSIAPLLVFLIHQRFAECDCPAMVSSSSPISFNDDMHRTQPSPNTPTTFAPYVQNFPSNASLPICWRRNELALLSQCLSGLNLLQEVAAHTLQLSADLITLVNGGILTRFPHVFPRAMITWDRWMWAASMVLSCCLPMECYLRKGEELAVSAVTQSAWKDLGVMVPLLDMMNHNESHAVQIEWDRPIMPVAEEQKEGNEDAGHDT